VITALHLALPGRTVDGYVVPHGQSYVDPVFTADRDYEAVRSVVDVSVQMVVP